MKRYVVDSEEKVIIVVRKIESSEVGKTPYEYKKRKMNERKQRSYYADNLLDRQQGKPLKLVSAIFYQIFIFAPNDIHSKIVENVFYFI